MQFIDLKAQYREIEAEIARRMQAVFAHGRYVLGPEVGELEDRLGDFCGVKHTICVASGTDALMVALMALDIGPGDEVITTPFTFIATAETIALLGARPVFVDIDPVTYNIDPERIAEAITEKTKAIMPVSLYGQCADMDAINEIAARHHLPVIEDAAQSLGATYKGRRSGALSTIGCTSFFPSKPLGCYGDGGACFTDDDTLATAMRQIANHGQDRRYHHPRIGVNSRLDSLQAAILLAKLEIFPDEIAARSQLGAYYSRQLRKIGARYTGEADSGLLVPTVAPDNSSVYAQYTVQVDDREAIQAHLSAHDIPTAVHYPVPLNEQPAIQAVCRTTETPVSTRLAQRVISLPMHPYLAEEAIDTICQLFAEA